MNQRLAHQPGTGQSAESGWLDDGEQRSWRSFVRGSQRLAEALNRDLHASHGLSMADYRILVVLCEAPDGALRMSDLATGTVSSRSRLTHQIRRLEAEGLVRRSNCESDGRGVLAVLSDRGRQRLVEAAPTHVAAVRRHLLDLLDDEDCDALGRIFDKVDRALAPESPGRF